MSVKIKFFSSESCKYCPGQERIVKVLAQNYGYPVEVIKREDGLEQFEKYNISGLPTVILLYSDKAMWSATGTVARNKIDEEFNKWSF